jgi:intracellular septation protein A
LAASSGVVLGVLPITAHAQYLPPWLIAATLSPVLVLLLCIILGVLSRSIRIGATHAAFVLAWVVLFSLAAYFVENDYVIWTPLALYVLHAVLLLVLIAVEIAKRISGRGRLA